MKTPPRRALRETLELKPEYEQTVHEKNTYLRERYIELAAKAEIPGANVTRIEMQLNRVGSEFVTTNAAFATAIVLEVARPGDDRAELYQEALLTLWARFLTWDPTRARFTSWAYKSMRGDANRAKIAVANEGSMGDYRAQSQTLAAIAELTQKLGHKPSIDELVTHTKLTRDKILRVLRKPAKSIDAPVSNHGDSSGPTTMGERLATPSTSGQANIEDLWKLHLRQALANLSMQEKIVILRRRGLDGCYPETLQQVGKWLRLGREPVRRAEARADRKLLAAGTPLPSAE
jgi:RNA polymerase sigma factor (sigma-70 family)